MPNHVPPAFSPQKLAWASLRAARGEAITFHVSETISISIPLAVLTRPSSNQRSIDDVQTLGTRDWHWLVDPDELIDTNGVQIEPKPGQAIERELDGQRYRVVLGPNELGWRWCDGSKVWRRIFCEEV